jgi:hypothetical protein
VDLDAPAIPNYKIFPSDLTYLLKSCKRCFYDKTKHQFKPPANFSEHFTNADRAMRQALASNETVDLGVGPKFRVISQGQWVESKPIPFESAGITLSVAGKYDAIVITEDNEVIVVDYKTTTLDDYALAKFAPQLMSYVTAIELPKTHAEPLAYVDGIAILVFDPVHFAFNPKTKNCGLYGPTRWVELPRKQDVFNELLAGIAELLAHPNPPRSAPSCDVCRLRFPVTTAHAATQSS